MQLTVSKRTFREAGLAAFFLMSFSILKFFPGMTLLKEGWIVAILFFLVTLYLIDRLAKGLRFTKFEGYALLLLVWVPISSAVQSRSEFGQPLVYGLLAQRNIVLVGSAIILLYLLRHNRITLADIEQALVKLAWACLAVFTSFTWLLDPGQFVDAGKGFVGGGNVQEAAFKFNTAFVVFGVIYYLFKGFWRHSAKEVMAAILFLAYLILIEGGRSLLLSVLGAYMFFLLRWSSFGRLANMLPKALVLVALLSAGMLIFKQEYMSNLALKFSDAFTVVLTGKETTDASANARIVETLIAKPFIAEHWAFGNGGLSNQWQGGFESKFGYFFPSDIGIIGALFLFGIVGVLLLSVQFLFAIRYADRLPKNGGEHGALVNAVKGYLLYYAIHSLVTGKFVHSVETGLLFISILYWAAFTAKHSNATVPITYLKNRATQ